MSKCVKKESRCYLENLTTFLNSRTIECVSRIPTYVLQITMMSGRKTMILDGTLEDLWSYERSQSSFFLVRDLSSENEFWDVLGMGQSSSFDVTSRRQGIRFCHLISTIAITCTVILAELVSLVTLQHKWKQQRKGIIKKCRQNGYSIAPA